MLNINEFSKKYKVKRLDDKDIGDIYNLCLTNPMYYKYCLSTLDENSIKEDIHICPKGKTMDDKYYVGFYDEENLIAIMDLIDNYPVNRIAFIGFFMVDAFQQMKGVGTSIINDLSSYLTDLKYISARLAWILENEKAAKFWQDNGFVKIKQTDNTLGQVVMLAEKKLNAE